MQAFEKEDWLDGNKASIWFIRFFFFAKLYTYKEAKNLMVFFRQILPLCLFLSVSAFESEFVFFKEGFNFNITNKKYIKTPFP